MDRKHSPAYSLTSTTTNSSIENVNSSVTTYDGSSESSRITTTSEEETVVPKLSLANTLIFSYLSVFTLTLVVVVLGYMVRSALSNKSNIQTKTNKISTAKPVPRETSDETCK